MTNNKTGYFLVAILFAVMLIIGVFKMYKNHAVQQKELQEKYIKTEAEITFAGRTGTGYRTKALLHVTYPYNSQNYRGTITRVYRKDGYYKKGDQITINLNPNNPEDIK